MDYYFIQDDGNMFKATYAYEPYFYIACKVRLALELSNHAFNSLLGGDGVDY